MSSANNLFSMIRVSRRKHNTRPLKKRKKTQLLKWSYTNSKVVIRGRREADYGRKKKLPKTISENYKAILLNDYIK